MFRKIHNVQAASFLDDKDTLKYVAGQFAPHLTNVESFGGEEYTEVCKHLEGIPALRDPTVEASLGSKSALRAAGPGSLLINFLQLPPCLHHTVLQRHYHNGHLKLQCVLMHQSVEQSILSWVFGDIGNQIAQLSPIRAFNLCMNSLPDALADSLLQGLTAHTSVLSLRLRCNRMAALSAGTLHGLLSSSLSTVQTLDLSDNTFSELDLAHISQAFPSLHALEHLTLSDVGLTRATPESFFRQLMHLSSLHTLDLSENNLGDNGCTTFGKVLESSPSVPPITRLALSKVHCGPEGLCVLGQSLQHLKSLGALVFLENKTCGDQGASGLFAGLSQLPQFVELTMHDAGLTVEYLTSPISGLTNLTRLDLSKNWFVGNYPGPVASAIACMPALKGLALSANSIGNTGCTAIAESIAQCPVIREIDLSENRIGTEGAAALSSAVAAIRSGLVTLSVAYNQMGDEGLLGIVSALSGTPPVIEELDVTRNFISQQFLDEVGPVLKRLEKLRSMHVEMHRSFGMQMQHFGQQYHDINIISGKDLAIQSEQEPENTSWKALARHCSDMKTTTFYVT